MSTPSQPVQQGNAAGVVHQSVDNGLAILTLNRPDRMNAINSEMATALNEALTAISIDKNIHAVVITGAGKGFCAGGDLKEICGSAAEKRQRIARAIAAFGHGRRTENPHDASAGRGRGEWRSRLERG